MEFELINKIANKEEAALEALHKLYYPRLIRFLYRLTNDKEHIVEIVNDVFFIIWKNAGQFRGGSSVSTWIFGIAYKKGLQNLSRSKNIVTLANKESTDLESASASIDEEFAERNNKQLLQQLNPQHRAVMELTYQFGYSYKEIAAIVGCPENTIKTRMFYGRKRLREIMQEHHYAENI